MSTPPTKKEPWYKRWIPKCGAKSKTSDPIPSSWGEANDKAFSSANMGAASKLKCLACNADNEVGASSSSFVCKNCHKVHRVHAESFGTTERRLSVALVADDHDPMTLVRTSSTTFIPVEYDADAQARPSEPVVPQCQVCMDGPGDVVLLPCTHGAICEACAKHIARNLSVGGNHCVKCRQEIRNLVRLNELYTDHATGVPVEVPIDSVRKGPPKVPPPPGLNKGKNPSGTRT
jgi:hypothetical protein